MSTPKVLNIPATSTPVALELLEIQEGDLAIDFGCMWGVMTFGMAKRGAFVISIDQTKDSLIFLQHRKKEEKFENILLILDDIRKTNINFNANIAIVNGVLEWLPEFGEIELKQFLGKKITRNYQKINPENINLLYSIN